MNYLSITKSITHFFLFLGCLLVFSNPASAESNEEIKIDLYRTNQITTKDVEEKIGDKLKKMAHLIPANSSNLNSESTAKAAHKLMEEVIAEIHSMGDFAYVNVSPVSYHYPNNKSLYFSIDVVDSKDKSRIPQLLSKPKETISDPDDLIKSWQEYESTGFDLAMQGTPAWFDIDKCPAHHCVFGFEHGALKKYEKMFNTLVPKNKKQLIAILQKDKDDKKRAAAAYLLAHLKSGQEVMEALSPSVFDSSTLVRNNVLHVVGGTLSHNPSIHFEPEKALFALDFPEERDRDKALLIIGELINKPAYSDYMKHHASPLLVEHLKLAQPSLHNSAYSILKKISGKNFADRDYKSWEQWVKSAQQKR